MKTVSIEIPDGKEVRWIDGILTLVDEPKSITKKIKNFPDAENWCRENGQEQVVNEYYAVVGSLCKYEVENWIDILAYMRLRVVTCALNEGWKPSDGDTLWFVAEDGGVWYHEMGDEFNAVLSTKLYFKDKELAYHAAEHFGDTYKDFCKGCLSDGHQ